MTGQGVAAQAVSSVTQGPGGTLPLLGDSRNATHLCGLGSSGGDRARRSVQGRGVGLGQTHRRRAQEHLHPRHET